jgi:dUTP pyrophosphatase
MTIPIDILLIDKTLPLPSYATNGDAGLDLRASAAVVIPARSHLMVPTGVALGIPANHVGLVHPRSGLAAKHGITVLNAPGTIDSGYRGEINVLLLNTSDVDFNVAHGDRIAQLVVQEYVTADLIEVDELTTSDRGAGGFGSTGVSS